MGPEVCPGKFRGKLEDGTPGQPDPLLSERSLAMRGEERAKESQGGTPKKP